MKKNISLFINNETLSKLEIIAFNKKINSGELIETILEKYLNNSKIQMNK
tara:strand:- start:962 stop:1111 length:150 start_codon:yes stop_codon:yes gene_type:complete